MYNVSSYFNLAFIGERDRSNRLLVALFKKILKKCPVDCVYEVGANSAKFSIEVREEGLVEKCVAFEANPYNYDIFTRAYNYEALGIKYLNLAVSDSDGTIQFQLMRNNPEGEVPYAIGNNSILKREETNITYEECSVRSVRLDSFCVEDASAKALWIDVEGAQASVLSGATETIQKTKAIFIEVEELQYWQKQWLVSDVTKFLENLGFVPVARDFEYSHQYNIIFVRKDLTYLLIEELLGYVEDCKKG